MAHATSQRRNIAPPPPPQLKKTSLDLPLKKKANSYSISKQLHPPHPTSESEDPTSESFAPSSTTIKNISNQFAKLYANHKSVTINVASLKGGISKSYLPVDTNSQAGGLSNSAAVVLDSSCITLTKSNSQHGARKDTTSSSSSSSKAKLEKDKNAPKKGHHHEGGGGGGGVDVDVEKAMARQNWKERRGVFYEEEIRGGRRKSFSCSKTELADFFSCNGVKVVAVDMPPFMQIHAVDSARKSLDSLEKFTSKSLALTLKKEFDGVYGPAWHCIVGTSFGSFVTHSVGGFMYFSMDNKLYTLLFKTTVRKAD